jgi:DNA-binding NarL/FixJ family response regulator
MSRILVIDDHAIVRSGIRRLLKDRAGTEILEAASGEVALKIVQASAPDLILLDLNLPALGGLELLRRLLRSAPGSAILIFSQHSEPIYAAKALEAGARGFVSKNAMPDELLEAVDTVLAGGTAIEKDIQREMAIRDVMEDAYLKPLSERDLEILRLLASGDTLSDIAEKLGIAYKTVANTLSRIKEKLGVGQTSDLVRIAVSRGLVDMI